MTTTDVEIRVLAGDDLQLRAATDEKRLVLIGRLAPYNKPTTIANAFTEEMGTGCAAKSIR